MIKMIKTVHRNMTGVSNMADQGRIILHFYSVCNLSIVCYISIIRLLNRDYSINLLITCFNGNNSCFIFEIFFKWYKFMLLKQIGGQKSQSLHATL